MKRFVAVFVLLGLLFCGSFWCYAKELQVGPTSRIDVPESCPDYRLYSPLPSVVIAISQTTLMAAIVQEGNSGDQFVMLVFVVQHNEGNIPDDVFVLAIMHSDMKSAGSPITKTFADKEWIDKGHPSGRLVEVEALPKDEEFYKNLVNKRFSPRREV